MNNEDKIENAILLLDEDGRGRHTAALAEGYTDEVCSECEVVFLAHKHFVRCNFKECPMIGTDRRSLLDRLTEGVKMKPLSEFPKEYDVYTMNLESDPPYVVGCPKDALDADNDEKFEIPEALAYYLIMHWSCTLEKREEYDCQLRQEGTRAAQMAIKQALNIAYIPTLEGEDLK